MALKHFFSLIGRRLVAWLCILRAVVQSYAIQRACELRQCGLFDSKNFATRIIAIESSYYRRATCWSVDEHTRIGQTAAAWPADVHSQDDVVQDERTAIARAIDA